MNETHFYTRRQNLLERMEEGVAIIAAAPHALRSNDTEYPYRQNSDFYYLCGLNESNAALVLIKTGMETKTLLYVEAYDAEHALWNGAKTGLDEARKRFRVDEVRDIADYPEIGRAHV